MKPAALFLVLLLTACPSPRPAEEPHPAKAAPEAAPAPAEMTQAPPAPAAQVRAEDGLQRALWRLHDARDSHNRRIADVLDKPGIPLSLAFKDGRVQVRNACNHIGGEYHLGPDGEFAIRQLLATRKACEPALMAAEARITTLLGEASRIELPANDKAPLRIHAGEGSLLVWQPIALPDGR